MGLTAPSIAAARDALRALGAEVSNLQLIGVPLALAAQLDDRCRIVSASCRGWCSSCAVPRAAVQDYSEIRARLSDGRDLPCPRCGAALREIELSTLASGSPSGGVPGAAGVPSSPSNARPARPIAAAVTTGRTAGRMSSRAFTLVAVIAVCAAAGIASVVAWHVRTQRSGRPAPSPGQGGQQGPAWVVEVSGTGPSEVAALAEAWLHAQALATAELEATLPERIRSLRGDPVEAVPGLLDRPGEMHVELEQIDARPVVRGGRVHVTVRYRMPEAARQRALGFYTRVESIWGLELVNAPPSRRAGVLVIAAPSGPVSVGDRIVSAGGVALWDLDSLHQLGDLRLRSQLDLVIERQDRRTLEISNPGAP